MELIITEKKPTICLNMIVKNESHIIKNTLEILCKKIKFDYWVICDTGSTDNTPQIITDFFKEKNIQGELFYDEWVNFSHNRTIALQRAYKKTQLLLIFDADDEIIGNITIPTQVLFDQYHLKFGSNYGTTYTRVILINNYKQFEFLSVIHEFISCKDTPSTSITLEGEYHVISGRTGSRNLDPDKYLKDALILEKSHKEALEQNDPLFHRYAYYCANSYKDYGRFEDAIKWYKITLNQEKQWNQEKYTACLYIYDCYKALNQEDTGFFYLVKSLKYDNERVECLYHLLVHYCCQDMHNVAYNYYLIVKDFFENRYFENTNISNKLFINEDKYNFFVPYYMILIADKVQDFKCVIRMFEIIFIKKQNMFQEWYIKHLLYNLQFFIQYVPCDKKYKFINLANDYIDFLYSNNINIQNFDFLNKDIYVNSGINIDKYITKEINNKAQQFSKNECMTSKNILIYTGFSNIEWNYTYMLNNALGGSEKAVAYIAKCFPQDYNIYISGHVKNEKIDNIQYIHLDEITNIMNITPFHTVIVSRYISFYEMFKQCSFYQSYIWAHDVFLLPYGCSLKDKQILFKWNKYINGCICLTQWHKELFIERYPILSNKIHLINNGIDIDSFTKINRINKIKNKFIYSSTPERGLNILLDLWPQILEKIPDATLSIASYGNFPSNSEEELLKNIIDKNTSIVYLGKLQYEKLYEELSSSEYWLYPTHWPETSCITALEMLMSEVICLYYPIAGLTYTMDKYGVQVTPGSEVNKIVSLTDEYKRELRENGRIYAESCSWNNKILLWIDLLKCNQKYNTNIGSNKNIAVKIINLEKRTDRLENMKTKLSESNINTYDIVNAVDGKKIKENNYIKHLFRKNDFYYRKGVIGAALSHYNLWKQLIDDTKNNLYCIFEDDVSFVDNFNEKLNKVLDMFNTEFCLLGGGSIIEENKNIQDLYLVEKYYEKLDGLYGYLITKDGAKKMVEFIHNNGITRAIDAIYSQVFNKISVVNQHIIFTKSYQLHHNTDTNIQTDYDFFSFNNPQYKETWIFYYEKGVKYEVIEDYLNSFQENINFSFVNDINNIPINADKIFMANSLFEQSVFSRFKYSDIRILIIEPLNYQDNLNLVLETFKKYPTIWFYSYSKSNLTILNNNQIFNTHFLPYINIMKKK
jgi:GR25 family glycosyltransferase involved in LPS biosynthesis